MLWSTPVSYGAVGTPLLIGVNSGLENKADVAAEISKFGLDLPHYILVITEKVGFIHATVGVLIPLILCCFLTRFFGEKRSFVEKIMRASLGSKNRKTWNKLFYLNDFNQTLSQTDAGKYETALEMLRLAPSSTNAQPWIVVKEGDNIHFFCNYKNSISDDMKKIKHLDLGIGLAHFHQTTMSEGLDGKFEIQDIKFSIPENMHYVISYSIK